MHIKVNSTRHTKAGTFRRGVTYEVDPKDRKVRDHVLPLLDGDNAAFVKVADPAAAAPAKKSSGKKAAPKGDDQVTPTTQETPPAA